MARIGQLIYAPEVHDKASGPLNAISQAAERTGASIEQLDTRVRRNEASFDKAAARLDVVEKAAQRVQKTTGDLTRTMEAAERAALAEGVAQDRLNAVLTSGAAAREAAALQAVRGLTAEQQAAALTRAGYANLAAQVQATAAAQANVGVRASQGLAAANDNAAASSGRMRAALGQAGFQVQDFATQVSMGQNALMAFGVQGAQLAGVFGPTGAIAGAALMIAVIAAQLLGMGENAQEAERRIESAFNAIKADSEGVRDVIKEIGDLYLTAAERAQALARAQRDVLAQNVDLRLSNSIQFQDAAATRIPQLEREIAVLERRAAVEADIARRSSRGGLGAPVDQTTDTTSALFVARSQLNGMRAEMDLMDRRIRELNEARQRLANAGNDQGYGAYGPDAPRAERARASVERLSEAEREYQQIMREAEGQITRTLTEEEKRANILDRLSQMLAEGSITGDQYVAAMETQRRAVAAVAEQEQQRASERAAQEAARTAQRAADTIERQNQQTTDSIVRYGADRFADMFSANSRGWAGMLDTFRSTFRSLMVRLAAEAVIRPIIAPVVQGLGLGQLYSGGTSGITSLLGLGGRTLGGPAGVADPGSTQGALNQAGQAIGLRAAGNFGGLGQAFTGQGLANTGYGWIDGALNASISSPTLASTGYVGAGGLPIVDGSAGLSVAGGIGGALGIAGGAYGIYSGLQRGGPGGYTTAAGGLLSAGLGAATLAGLAVPGIGWAVAAGLAIAGALMPGQQASGRGQLARVDLGRGNTSFDGLDGDRFSQGNRDAATNTVSSIADLTRQIGAKLGGATIGGTASVGVTSSRGSGPGTLYIDINGRKDQFANDEAGSKALAEAAARFVLEEFKSQGAAQGDYAGILAASGSVEQLSQNLDWYEKSYKVMIQSAEATNEFAQGVAALRKPYDDAIGKARELSLAEGVLVQKRDEAIAKAQAARDAEVQALRDGVTSRGIAAGVVAGDQGALLYGASVAGQARQAAAEVEQLRARLLALGETSDAVAKAVKDLEAAQAGEAAMREAERARQVSDVGLSLGARRERARGNNLAADLIEFDQQATAQIRQARAEMERLGLTSADVAQVVLATEQTLAEERLALVKRYADQAADAQISSARSVLDWLNNQALGATSSLSPTARLAEAERQFNEAVNSGDSRRLTSAADALLQNSQIVFGGATEAYAQRETWTRQVLINRATAATNDSAVVTAIAQLGAVFAQQFDSLRAELAAQTGENRRRNDRVTLA